MDEKDQIIFELSSECGNLEAQLGFEQTRNQIVYDTLNSVVIERDILAKKYAHAKGKIERRERGLRKLSEQLTTEEELVDIKQRRIDNLTEQVNKLKSKNNSQQEKIILLVQQLENQNKNFTRLIKKLVKKVAQLNKKGNREHNRKRINNLNQKLEVLTTEQETLQTENNSLKGQLTYYQDQDSKLRTTIHSLQSHVCPPPVPHACSPCSLPHLPTPHVCPVIQQINCSHTDYDNLKTELTEKENIIQRQAQRIRELENKPPLVETKTQIKEVIREVEKEVEKPTATLNAPFNEDLIKIIEINLQGLEKELNIPLSSEVKEVMKKATNYQELSSIRNQEIKSYLEKERNTGITSQPKEIIKPIARERIIWISLLAVSLLVIGGLVVKLRKSSNKRSLS